MDTIRKAETEIEQLITTTLMIANDWALIWKHENNISTSPKYKKNSLKFEF